MHLYAWVTQVPENAMPYDERDDSTGKFTETFPAEDFLEAIAALDGEAGTSEVADEVGCAYRTAKAKLDALEEAGDVVSRRVGSALLWRLAEGADA